MNTKVSSRNSSIEIGGERINPGERKAIKIPIVAMATHETTDMTAHVINGKSTGPTLFVSAAIHGDEINGVEIIRRLLKQKQIARLNGTLIAIPIVNIHGFITQSRYLPDGRDLNRSFPGSEKGSLAGRMAHTFFNEVIAQCTQGIDLHTGARHRENLPQIRADMSQEETRNLATAFGVPAIIDSKIRDGSLRAVTEEAGIPVLLYEAGEALRFDEISIRAGVRGILNVMRHLGMLPRLKNKEPRHPPIISNSTAWVRATHSGVLRALLPLGAKAEKGSTLGVIADPLGDGEYPVIAPEDAIVIGRTNLPLTHEGDALFHLAYYKRKTDTVLDQVEEFQERFEPNTLQP
ncbi:succinylglutamate desuccinylase/aspartoacylase family protein [Marinibactrum halimedae]|uniref:Succinylglutamate desuccinylase n=1 Tax=Marinibactrum halimedae TaxID=1444977 RepID=A0AA37TFP0_9GAMM|nr:succinylglutamate desuccinylase/aspartoacylase family protein [Marinibactrum halimedae]MCD9459528.1 succinylglutamate desuccinylase/aspartoacylase family protein [Marinibactrum halimedae]GLS28182.1 succinylglutamate desuccinylase [Marinibactrum halimedae]